MVTISKTENNIRLRDNSLLFGAWALLVVLTAMSWWASDHGLSIDVAVAAILVLTFLKVYVVGLAFMEVRSGPVALRVIFFSWCAGTCFAVIGMMLLL